MTDPLSFFSGGKMKNLTTAQRWKRKKDPEAAKEDEETSEKIAALTELANELLTRTGNMDIYQENYEQIKKKINVADKRSVTKMDTELDMYADDFDTKEKEKIGENKDTEGNDIPYTFLFINNNSILTQTLFVFKQHLQLRIQKIPQTMKTQVLQK